MEVEAIIALIAGGIGTIAAAIASAITTVKKALKREDSIINIDSLLDAINYITSERADFDTEYYLEIIESNVYPVHQDFMSHLIADSIHTKSTVLRIGLTQIRQIFENVNITKPYMLLVSLAICHLSE